MKNPDIGTRMEHASPVPTCTAASGTGAALVCSSLDPLPIICKLTSNPHLDISDPEGPGRAEAESEAEALVRQKQERLRMLLAAREDMTQEGSTVGDRVESAVATDAMQKKRDELDRQLLEAQQVHAPRNRTCAHL